MAASFNDMSVLAANTAFQNRVQMALVLFCTVVGTESPTTVVFHRERQTFAAAVLNSPATYMPLFTNVVSVNATVIGDATQGGTVALTTSNIAAQEALVLDADISNAIAAQFNSFFRVPAN